MFEIEGEKYLSIHPSILPQGIRNLQCLSVRMLDVALSKRFLILEICVRLAILHRMQMIH